MSVMSGHREGAADAQPGMLTAGVVGKTDKLRIGARRLGHARDDGFTLIESLTAAAILLIIAVAIVTTLIATGGWYSSARTRTEANTVANEVMSLILSRNYSDIHYAGANESRRRTTVSTARRSRPAP
jgi:prepilin-type N-terminal cleavage/methylation domain-containing protein